MHIAREHLRDSVLTLAYLFGLMLAASPASAQQTRVGAWRDSAAAIPLWPTGAPGALGTTPLDTPTVTPYLPAAGHANGAAVVIFPGGGYEHLATDKEGVLPARWLNTLGVSAFVVRYRLGPRYHYPAMLDDARRAVRFVRANAARWGVDTARIGVMGFSAGGHMAAMAGTHFESGARGATDPVERVSSRPDFMILVYPVITMREPLTHRGSRVNLLGPDSTPALVQSLSNETQVTAATPPTFLVATTDDRTVPVENTLMFYEALHAAHVPAEMHIYESGPHGFGLAPEDPVLSSWTLRCAAWLHRHRWATPAP